MERRTTNAETVRKHVRFRVLPSGKLGQNDDGIVFSEYVFAGPRSVYDLVTSCQRTSFHSLMLVSNPARGHSIGGHSFSFFSDNTNDYVYDISRNFFPGCLCRRNATRVNPVNQASVTGRNAFPATGSYTAKLCIGKNALGNVGVRTASWPFCRGLG